jgi:hypothetical protein
MGTLCKNCPVRNAFKESGQPCTIAFATKYGNSCVNLDITEHLFNKELEEFSKEKKKKANTPKKEKKAKSTKKKDEEPRRIYAPFG